MSEPTTPDVRKQMARIMGLALVKDKEREIAWRFARLHAAFRSLRESGQITDADLERAEAYLEAAVGPPSPASA